MRQSVADNVIGSEIGVRDRRAVSFARNRHGAAIDRHNGSASPDHEIGQGFHQRRGGVALDVACGRTCLIHGRDS